MMALAGRFVARTTRDQSVAELRVLIVLTCVGLLLGVGLRQLEGKAVASDPCGDSYMGFALREDVRRIEGDGSIEAQLYWPVKAIFSTSFPAALDLRHADDGSSFELEIEPEPEP